MQKKQLKAGLVGHPLSKSLSIKVFEVFAGLTGEEIDYAPVDCAPEDLARTIPSLKAQGWAGFNVTIPYKREVCAMLDLADPAAKCCGAVNAVRFGRAGLEGLNTDARALLQAIEEAGFSARGGKAVVFGSGGSAASSGWALGRAAAASVTFRARNRAAAEELASRLSSAFPDTLYGWAPFEAPPDAPDILVNATPLGMYASGGPPAAPARGALCADLAYAPGGTGFTAAAKAAGALAIDGLSLLVRQAALSLRFWSGLPTGDIVEFSRKAEKLFREALEREG
ncbi:MAG: hypothetical protein M0025_05025 [Elusimicrobia bacterium]|nr:hypothetical protein [Elusimicrobiota bacterium]